MITQAELTSAVTKFQTWSPAMGSVFPGSFAFDCETTAIDENRRWFTPALVLGAAFDGQRGVFIHRDQMLTFYLAHRDRSWWLADAINAEQDPHRLVAAQVTGKLSGEITKQERQQAKAINFGKPGGMGNRSLQRYAQASYGVTLDDQAVEVLSEAWFEQFPEMRQFLQQDEPFGTAVSTFFGLTPSAHLQHTDNKKFVDHPENRGRENIPHPILGCMFLKVMAEACPQTRAGRDYSAEDIDFFWSQAAKRVADLSTRMQVDVRARRPSKRTRQLMLGFTDRGSVITLTGRLRANATFCARRNTLFQGLAADGAKLALWHLWRAGYAIHNFIHDEVLVAVPEGPLLGLHAQIIQQLMIKGMREVVPDVRVSVEYVATRRWSKNAKLIRDDGGRLMVWEPAAVHDLASSEQSLAT